MRRICVVITARPSYSRIKSVLHAIQDRADLELQLVVTGSALLDKYGSVIDSIEADGFTPRAQVHMLVEGESLLTSAKSTGLGIMELSTTFDLLRPDVVLTIADRYETIATAIAAAYQNIPLAHVQGGEVTGSIDEKVRHAVTKLSDLHLVANEQSAKRVIRMGEDLNKVYMTGCPSIDLVADVLHKSGYLDRSQQIKGVGANVDLDQRYLVVMQHPVTYEWDEAKVQMESTLEAVASLGMPTLWFWPNVDAGSDASSRAIRVFREKHGDTYFRFVKNLPPEAFLELLSKALCLIGNSSVGVRECSYMGVPVVNIGSRQTGRDRSHNLIDTGHVRSEIKMAIEQQIAHGSYEPSKVYGDGAAGPRIAEILATTTMSVEKRICY
ncbi:MAG: UDP-N-acetylglucosamine 2-epimerase [Burkholderiales bacterium]|nr:UDP-N-acetylglucosamine 2-epimerase [Burkholderiales bacterium]